MTVSKTYIAKPKLADRKWVLIDAEGQVLGKLAVRVANVLRGKDQVTYTPHIDHGSGVIVTNAAKIVTTGNKLEQKIYTHYSGYPSGLKRMQLKDMLIRHPERVIERAVQGMLPHNRLGRQLMRHLRVVVGSEHPHQAQVANKKSAAGKKPPQKSEKKS